MCGIIGYTGNLDAEEVLLKGLSQLEYRGYDSAGIALENGNGDVTLYKQVGQVSNLKEVCQNAGIPLSHCGIGHTRWATHGGVTEKNAHPHQAGKVTLIHNGIIENYHELMDMFHLQGKLVSETDTEVATQVIDHFYDGDPLKAIHSASEVLKGPFAFCILFADIPERIYCVRNVSPLVAAMSEHGAFVASDLTALISYSNSYFIVPEYHIMVMDKDQITLLDEQNQPVQPEMLEVNWDVESAQKCGYPFYMLKEIHEQPEAIRKTVLPRIKDGLPDFKHEQIPDSLFANCENIAIVACGTAMYAGMVGKALMEPMLRIPVSVNIASEFRYEQPLADEKTLVIVISQSGETIDTLAALRLAKSLGSPVLAVVNVKGSTIARESDYVLYTHAGPEIAVASTKAYAVQLASMYLIACRMSLVRGRYSVQEGKEFIENLLSCVPAIEKILEQTDAIEKAALHIMAASDTYFIGRGLDYAYSLEGALKLKEISYIHAEAYAAGELKHGTIALIEEHTPVVAFATQSHVFQKTISNIREVRARGAYVILITKESAEIPEGICDIHFTVDAQNDQFTGLPTVAILQLLAYYTSLSKGLDVDKPRNLAKSVTVE